MAALAALPAFIAANAGTIATIASGVGTAVGAVGAIEAGKADSRQARAQGLAQKQAADFQAAQIDAKAKEERAQGQQEAEEFRRKKSLALSTLQNRAAGSGFSATDPTALALADEISKYGTLQEQMAAYGGASRAEGLKSAAAGERYSGNSAYSAAVTTGKAARKASYFDAAGTILGGVSTLADRYGKRAAPAKTSSYRYG